MLVKEKTSKEIKIYKINETKNYGKCFVTNLPVKFFFNKDGSYDGFEINVCNCTEKEKKLLEEFCRMFPDKFYYTIEEDEN